MGKIQPRIQKSLLLILVGTIKCYGFLLRPLLGYRCRFYPSCSSYATEALRLYGLYQGTWLTIKRLLRCHPWHEGGFDPVPPNIK